MKINLEIGLFNVECKYEVVRTIEIVNEITVLFQSKQNVKTAVKRFSSF